MGLVYPLSARFWITNTTASAWDPSFMPTGNIQADLEPIFEFYQQMTGA